MSSFAALSITLFLNLLCFQYDYNVIIVGWFRGALELWYPQAASNTRVVGRQIGNVARNLVENGGAKASNVWCVGHSLGSHVCGHAGTSFKIGRITGMDIFIMLFNSPNNE